MGDTEGEIIDVWDLAQLMGKSVSFKGIAAGDLAEDGANGGEKPPVSPRRMNKRAPKDTGIDKLMLWGQPGHLTPEEADVYMKFKEIVAQKDKDFLDTIYAFGREEGEVYAYCRWLRARKFNLDDTIKMIGEATECSEKAKADGYYPDPNAALGCDTSAYLSQYPQLYSGFAKNGAPVYFSKPGVLNTDAVECVTTIPNIVKFHWHAQIHDFGGRLRDYKTKNPNFKRFECICVMDLENLTMAQLSQKTLSIIKDQSAIDSLCFPETLCKMYIVNGPRFFSATWKLIKGWLDPRTASKVEVVSDRKKWEEKLREIIDVEELPKDYGGNGPLTDDTIQAENYSGNLRRVHGQVLYLRGHGSTSHEIKEDEELDITIYTRSTAGAKFTITDVNHGHEAWATDVLVKHTGGETLEDLPSSVKITETKISGPANVKVKADSNSGRFSTNNFFVVFAVHRKE